MGEFVKMPVGFDSAVYGMVRTTNIAIDGAASAFPTHSFYQQSRKLSLLHIVHAPRLLDDSTPSVSVMIFFASGVKVNADRQKRLICGSFECNGCIWHLSVTARSTADGHERAGSSLSANEVA